LRAQNSGFAAVYGLRAKTAALPRIKFSQLCRKFKKSMLRQQMPQRKIKIHKRGNEQ